MLLRDNFYNFSISLFKIYTFFEEETFSFNELKQYFEKNKEKSTFNNIYKFLHGYNYIKITDPTSKINFSTLINFPDKKILQFINFNATREKDLITYTNLFTFLENLYTSRNNNFDKKINIPFLQEKEICSLLKKNKLPSLQKVKSSLVRLFMLGELNVIFSRNKITNKLLIRYYYFVQPSYVPVQYEEVYTFKYFLKSTPSLISFWQEITGNTEEEIGEIKEPILTTETIPFIEPKEMEDKSKEDKSKEDKSKENKSKEDKSKEDKSKENKSLEASDIYYIYKLEPKVYKIISMFLNTNEKLHTLMGFPFAMFKLKIGYFGKHKGSFYLVTTKKQDQKLIGTFTIPIF